ncbi:T9SS type A sorting domain-containing protein [candidate division WOR-3 bacterium]|nr:T9SS type A sorting domain-containing protein [candidate division WOR-3 bacterium]
MAVNARDRYIFCDTVQVIASPRYVCYLRSTILDPGPGGNNDSILNPGETVKIPMWIKNWGQQTANSVTARLRTYDPNAQITDSAKTFGNIVPGDSAYTGDDGFGLHVNPGPANGYPVTCSLYCKDEFDSTWISVALFLVGTPAIATQAVVVVDTAHGGNNNARIDPDETADLMVMVRNNGMGHAYNCRAVLRSGDIRFTVLDSTADYGLIRKGDSAGNAADLFAVRADASILPKTPIPCTLYYYADGGYVRSEPLTIVVGEPRACEPIPDGPRKPTLYYAYDDTDTLYPAHPTYDWVEVNSVGTILTFAQNDDVVLLPLPPEFGPLKFYGQEFTEISVSADGWISPGNHTAGNCANASLPDPADPPGMICANWDDLYPASGGGTGCVYCHHDTANHRFVIEYDSVQYYFDTNHDKFQVIIYDTTIATHSGDNAILVQYMTANRHISSTIGIEDPNETIAIQVLYNGTRHKAAAPIAERRAILYTTDPPFPVGMNDGHHPAGVPVKLALDIYPNPVRSRVSIAWAQPAAGRVSVKVYDAAGRVVRDLVGGKLDAGRYSLTWDGLAEDGGRVSDGVYFCQLVTAAGARQHKLILARR